MRFKMMARFRESPATIVLSALWLLVFAAMIAAQLWEKRRMSVQEAMIGLQVGHEFGSMSLEELFNGEIWRAVTSTFVHFGIAHVGLNLIGFFILGCVIESWYGSGQFLGIYVLTGGGGNLLSGLARRAIGSNPQIPSGGGSTVIMGLVGLCAVVGWRARTREGNWMRNSMLMAIATTAGLGVGLSVAHRIFPRAGIPLMDNWGHACGTLVGMLLGFADSWMIRQQGRRWAKIVGSLSVLIIVASAGAQVVDDRVDKREQFMALVRRAAKDEVLAKRIDEIGTVYRAVANPNAIQRGALGPPLQPPATTPAKATGKAATDPERAFFQSIVVASNASLESMAADLDTGDSSADFRRALQILRESAIDPPTIWEAREFDFRVRSIRDRLNRDSRAARAKASGIPNR